MSKYQATVGRKSSILTGRNLEKDQAQTGANTHATSWMNMMFIL